MKTITKSAGPEGAKYVQVEDTHRDHVLDAMIKEWLLKWEAQYTGKSNITSTLNLESAFKAIMGRETGG